MALPLHYQCLKRSLKLLTELRARRKTKQVLSVGPGEVWGASRAQGVAVAEEQKW